MAHDEFGWIIPTAINLLKSVFSEAKKIFQNRRQRHEQGQEDYVFDSIGDQSCLSPDCYEPGTVSFDTVDLRVRLKQKQNPQEAKKLNLPDPSDPRHKQKVEPIVKRLEAKQRLIPGKHDNRWKKAELNNSDAETNYP